MTIMRVTSNGQISLPAEVRRRWAVDRVIVIDTPHGLVVRPYDPNAIDRLRGKYAGRGPTVDGSRQAGRAEPGRAG